MSKQNRLTIVGRTWHLFSPRKRRGGTDAFLDAFREATVSIYCTQKLELALMYNVDDS